MDITLATSDIIGIVSLIVALISSYIAIKQNINSHRFQTRLAAAQKAFAKENIKINFFKTSIKDIIFIINFPEKSIVTVPLNIYIGNIGEKSVKKSELYITFPDEIHEYNLSNITIKTIGTLQEIKPKIVDKMEHKHMIGVAYGNIPARTAFLHCDSLILSDFRETNSTVMNAETTVQTKDHVMVSVKYGFSISWLIDCYLRHEEGSVSERCRIQIWDISKTTIEEYYKNFKTNEEDEKFNEYIKKRNLLIRKFFKKRLHSFWKQSVKEVYLAIELDVNKINPKTQSPEKDSTDAEEFSLFEANIKEQNILLHLNEGSFIKMSSSEYEKGLKISNHFRNE
ncbi:MAG: hypothetical protein V1775_06765 [Bacteroidota bacterium]